jgi:putative transposase
VVLGTCARECLALEVATGFGGHRVARVPPRVGIERGRPAAITVDRGIEFASRALEPWAYRNRLQLDYTRPGKPNDNNLIGSFDAAVRRECPSQHYFTSLEEAR